MRVYEEYTMFKLGIETMFPPGSLIFLKHLIAKKNFIKSTPIYKENPHYCKTAKEKTNLKSDEVMRGEPFTIMEIDTELIPGGGLNESFSLYFEYKVYFHILQFDKMGWITFHTDATRYDEALKNMAQRIVFAKDVEEQELEI